MRHSVDIEYSSGQGQIRRLSKELTPLQLIALIQPDAPAVGPPLFPPTSGVFSLARPLLSIQTVAKAMGEPLQDQFSKIDLQCALIDSTCFA